MTAPVYTIGQDEAAANAWETMRFRRTRQLVVSQGCQFDVAGELVNAIRSRYDLTDDAEFPPAVAA